MNIESEYDFSKQEPQGLSEETPEQEPKQFYEAAVVLSCGFNPEKPDELDLDSKLRTLAGGILATQGKIGKLILSGGPIQAGSPPIAEAMKSYLLEKFPELENFDVSLDLEAMDTEENASYSADLLRAQGKRSAILITNKYHLARSKDAFARAGIKTDTLSAEELVKSRSSHHELLVRRYIKSPKYFKSSAIDIILRQIAKTESGRQMLNNLAHQTRG